MSAPRIRVLPRELVNRIAAGEVVERPASVVKELLENSIDAGASRVEIALEDGGKRLLRVSDDGCGMGAEDLRLAFASHATSKLSAEEDLFDIHTFGFRGEALASIASVGRCRAVSRERGSPEGASVECEAGRLGEVRACGAPEGTLIEVRDLFFNIPARLKFLRSTATELRHAVEAATRLALPHHALALTLIHNKRPVLKLPSCENARLRLAAFHGDELCSRLLPVRLESAPLTVTGFISPPGEGLPSQTQYVFLNGRYIRDRSIQRAVAEAYRGRLAAGRFPAAFLFLTMDPSRVDVNVHPTKIEVRFRDPGAVFAQTLTALEQALRAARPEAARAAPAAHAGREENVRRAMAEFFGGAAKQEPAERRFIHPPHIAPPSAAAPVVEQRAPLSVPSATSAVPHAGRLFCQIHDAYIIEQTPEGFQVIDQHALHERILYEELRRRVGGAAVPRQRLLVPEVVDLRPGEFLAVMELRETLLRMGVEVEPFGESTVAVNAVPTLVGAVHPRELIEELLAEPSAASGSDPAAREEALMRVIACKGAIKAGERLSARQVEALLEQRDRVAPEPICPHGRPTTLRFDLREMEKQFQRR